jgi:hypothetical protein
MIRANYYLLKVKLNCCVVVLLVKDSVEWTGLTHASIRSSRYVTLRSFTAE